MLPEILFTVAFLLQLLFYLGFFFFYSLRKAPEPALSERPVSIVVCARNEADNLKRLLPSLAIQDYAEAELILVDDGSDDETLPVMRSFRKDCERQNFRIEILAIPKGSSAGKKKALAAGIRRACYERILLTDADCRCISANWVREMMRPYETGYKIVLGYGAYERIKGSFMNKLIRMETLLTALQYFSYALAGIAYMGVGRNLSYEKEVFESTGGFKDHEDLLSGDDDLFVSRAARSARTGICDHPDSFTVSLPPENFSAWIRQKRRHITTSHRYSTLHQVLLSTFYLSQLSFYVLGIWLIATGAISTGILILILIRFVVWYMATGVAAVRLREKDLLALAPIYEISIIFIQSYLFLRNSLESPKRW